MRTNTVPWDYQQRRFNHREHAKFLAITFSSTPVGYDEWPEELRLSWSDIHAARKQLRENPTANRVEKRAMNDKIKELSAAFGLKFDIYWNNGMK